MDIEAHVVDGDCHAVSAGMPGNEPAHLNRWRRRRDGRAITAWWAGHRHGHGQVGARRQALRELRRRAQIIYQDPYEALDPRWRVRQIVAEPLLIHRVGASAAERAQRVAHALRRAGLTPPERYLDRYPHELSGGQRQRAAIAASLTLDPRLLIADEPVSMLDVSTKAAVLSTLDGLRRDGQMGVLLITHDLVTAGALADRIVVMYRGRIVEEAAAPTLLRTPQHPYTRALLSAVPRLASSR